MFVKKILTIFFLICLIFLLPVSHVQASVYSANGSELSSENLSAAILGDPSLISGILPSGQVIFFTNTHCGVCHIAHEFLQTIVPSHPEMTLVQYDLFNSTENRTVFENYKAQYHRTYLSTPSILVGNLTLEGNQAIRDHLEEILSLQKMVKRSHSFLPDSLSPSLMVTEVSPGEIPFFLIIGAGLLDGINPCAFAVLVFLLVYLMALKSRREMLTAGFVYTGAVFIFYFLSGVGIFSVIQTTGATTAFSLGAGCIAFIAGVLMIMDAVFPKEKPILAIPASQSGLINRIVKQATLPAAFILGILVGMFELPCTGGIYLSIISMISLKSNLNQALGYLFIYNIAFVLPLLMIIGLVTIGLPPERVHEWRLEQRRALRGIIGIVLIGFATYILYEVLG
jgi:cytochrome c biogenesis protein CcdA